MTAGAELDTGPGTNWPGERRETSAAGQRQPVTGDPACDWGDQLPDTRGLVTSAQVSMKGSVLKSISKGPLTPDRLNKVR